MRKTLLRAGAAAALFLGVQASAQAESVTANMQVSADVAAACLVSASPLSFGTYVMGDTLDLDGTTTVSVICSPDAPISISMNAGLNGDAQGRKMINGASELRYELYQDPSRTQVWGDTVETSLSFTSTGAPQEFTVFGRVPNGQMPDATGTHTDMVIVSVNF